MEGSTRENFKMIKEKGTENLGGKMEEFTRESGQMENSMELVTSSNKKEPKLEKANGLMEKE